MVAFKTINMNAYNLILVLFGLIITIINIFPYIFKYNTQFDLLLQLLKLNDSDADEMKRVNNLLTPKWIVVLNKISFVTNIQLLFTPYLYIPIILLIINGLTVYITIIYDKNDYNLRNKVRRTFALQFIAATIMTILHIIAFITIVT